MSWSEEQYAAYLKGKRTNPELERDFQRQLKAAAARAGWLYYHVANSKRSEPGFPDTVLVKGSTVLFAELKMPWGVLSPAQRIWGDALSKVERVEYHVWVPDDFAEISERLRL